MQVLVGSTSSLYADTNRGVFEVNGSSSSILGLKIGDTNGGYILHTGTDLAIWNAKNGSQTFATNNTERMRLTSGGELLINTTSDAGDFKLQVNGDMYLTNSTYTQMQLKDGSASGSTWSLISGFPNLGDFTIREAGVQNTLILKKTTGNAEFIGSIKTAAPSGGTAKPWKLGEAGVTSG